MISSAIRKASEVKVGDRITEHDTPEGPFYPVLKVDAKSFVIDAAHAMRPGQDEEDLPVEPVRFPIRPTGSIRVAV